MRDKDRWIADKRDVWIFILLLTLVTWTFRGIILCQKDPFLSSLRSFEPWRSCLTVRDQTRPESFADDPTTQSYPWAYYAHDNLKKGDFPLWNKRMYSGTPFTANRLTGLYDPTTLIPIWLFPPKTGLAIFYFIHYLFAAWFMYLFLKCMGISRPSATFGAIAYIFQGAYIPWMGFIVADKAYIIASLYYLEKICDRKEYPGLIGFLLSCTLLSINSYPQMMVFAIYIFAAWVLFIRKFKFKATIRNISALTLMMLTAFLLGSMQNIPMIEFYNLSLRAQPEFETELSSSSLLEQYDSPLTLIAIAFPRIFGDYLTNPGSILPEYILRIYNHAYIGILSVVCFMLWPLVRKNRYAMFFTVMSLLGLLFIAWHDFYMLVAKIVPGFRISTVKPDFLTLSSMIIVSSFVLDKIIRELSSNKILAYWFIRAYGWILGAVLGLSCVAIIAKAVPGFFTTEDFLNFMSIFAGAIIVYFAGALLYLHVKRGLKIKWVIVGIIILEIWDLVPYHEHFMPLVDKDRTIFSTPSIQYLQNAMQREGPFRIFRDRRVMFAPNTPMLFDLDEIGGFDSFVSADYAHFFRNIDPAMSKNSRTLDLPENYISYMQPFWSFLGVRYLIAPSKMPLLPPPWKLVWEGEAYIYENLNWLPRWYLVGSIIVVNTLEESYQAATQINPSREAVVQNIPHEKIPPALLEGPFAPDEEPSAHWEISSPNDKISPGSIICEKYGADELRLKVTCYKDSYLVFSDTYFPGWRAWIDDKEVEIYRTNGIIKGIVVPEGTHSIRFLYDPVSHRIGWFLFFAGLILTPFSLKLVRNLLTTS